MRRLAIAAVLFIPFAAFAANSCKYEAPRNLQLDLTGVRLVHVEVNSQTLHLSGSDSAKGLTVSGRACASEQSMLDDLKVTQRRAGDQLYVDIGGDSHFSLSFFGHSYSSLPGSSQLPAIMPGDVNVGAGADDVKLIAYCIDDRRVDAEELRPVVEAFPNARILTRVFDRRQLLAIDGAGASGAVREVFESSIALGLMALEQLDIDRREIEDVEAALRHLDEVRLDAQLVDGDLSAGMDHRFQPGGSREGTSILEKLRETRRAAKLAKEEAEGEPFA